MERNESADAIPLDPALADRLGFPFPDLYDAAGRAGLILPYAPHFDTPTGFFIRATDVGKLVKLVKKARGA
jgi:hypothetical protein